jgi:hypothetical protein
VSLILTEVSGTGTPSVPSPTVCRSNEMDPNWSEFQTRRRDRGGEEIRREPANQHDRCFLHFDLVLGPSPRSLHSVLRRSH